MANMLPAMGVSLLSPNIPALNDIFGHQSGGAYLVSMALTIPALAIALLSSFAGFLVDRIGRRKSLLASLGLYAVFGVAPAFSESLQVFVVMRALLGIVEAVIMTSSFALVADYFHGSERNRWLSYNTSFTAVASIFVYIIAGALGTFGWQYPFLFYGIAAPIFLLAVLVVWEPSRRQLVVDERVEDIARSAVGVPATASPVPFLFFTVILVSVLAGALFFVIPLQTAVYLGERTSITSAQTGILISIATVGNAIGALSFRYFANYRTGTVLSGCLLLSSFGLFALPFAHGAVSITAAAFVNQLGAGMLPALLMAAAMRLTRAQWRGRGGGLWWASFSIGNFLSPIIMVRIVSAVGSLQNAFMLVGIVSILVGLLSLLVGTFGWLSGPRPDRHEQSAIVPATDV
ncbi:MFS transporter [Nocardia jiangxiensis]|uniref:MFS transporter n=1 Tax=Nocardia jiangxiensis TaxID=282685 RepID=A0ABW6S135_9NOCA